MLILLSPAKTLDLDTPSRVAAPTRARHLEDAETLVRALRRKSAKGLGELMGLSESLAALNRRRYRDWTSSDDDGGARPAIEAFRGDVYAGFDVDTLDAAGLDAAQARVRILSGLYGVLRPLDLVRAHRLEMGTRLATRRGPTLYAFWGSRLTEALAAELAGRDAPRVVDLASKEYSRAVDARALPAPVIRPAFLDERGGALRTVPLFAKRARGAMARYLVDERADSPEALAGFDALGYAFDAERSTEAAPVFTRSEKAARRAAA